MAKKAEDEGKAPFYGKMDEVLKLEAQIKAKRQGVDFQDVVAAGAQAFLDGVLIVEKAEGGVVRYAING